MSDALGGRSLMVPSRRISARDVRMARRYIACHEEPAGGWTPEHLMQGAEVPDWGDAGDPSYDREFCSALLAAALDCYREVPAENLPDGVGPGSFNLMLLRLAAERCNRDIAYPSLELRPWVVLTLLDAYEELEEIRGRACQTQAKQDREGDRK